MIGPSAAALAAMKVILVTGGNKGIGYAICKQLLLENADVHVLLGSRDKSRGEKAVTSIKEILPEDKKECIELLQIDTSSDESVSNAANEFSNAGCSLYGIVNNAGIGWGYTTEETLDTNYWGTKRINDAFYPYLKRPGGRIVNIASASGPNFLSSCSDSELKGTLANPLTTNLDDLEKLSHTYKDKPNQNAYGLSKAFVNAYTVLYAKEHPDLIVNSCTPGFIITDMTEGLSASNPPEVGAKTPMYLLLSSDFESLPTGRYYGSDGKRSPIDRYREPGSPPYDGP